MKRQRKHTVGTYGDLWGYLIQVEKSQVSFPQTLLESKCILCRLFDFHGLTRFQLDRPLDNDMGFLEFERGPNTLVPKAEHRENLIKLCNCSN